MRWKLHDLARRVHTRRDDTPHEPEPPRAEPDYIFPSLRIAIYNSEHPPGYAA
jgi:hypothetical protein